MASQSHRPIRGHGSVRRVGLQREEPTAKIGARAPSAHVQRRVWDEQGGRSRASPCVRAGSKARVQGRRHPAHRVHIQPPRQMSRRWRLCSQIISMGIELGLGGVSYTVESTVWVARTATAASQRGSAHPGDTGRPRARQSARGPRSPKRCFALFATHSHAQGVSTPWSHWQCVHASELQACRAPTTRLGGRLTAACQLRRGTQQ